MMVWGPEAQAKMALEERFRQAQDDKKVNWRIKFQIRVKNIGGVRRLAYCIDGSGARIEAVEPVNFNTNITD